MCFSYRKTPYFSFSLFTGGWVRLGLSLSLQSQAKASFSVAYFLQQKRRETFVSHLPASTHASVKHLLLVTPSLSLFADSVIKESFTQAKEDCNLAVLKNLSSAKGCKQSASTASSSGVRRSSSASGSSASRFYQNSFISKGSKCQSSSSLARPSKVSLMGSSRSPEKSNFRK